MKRTLLSLVGAIVVLSLPIAATQSPPFETPRSFELVEATIPDLQQALETHFINSKQLVKLYLDRIAAYEPLLNAFIQVNPSAIDEAHQLDIERAQGHIRGPLHGIPIVLKDNVHTTDMPTTGGALAFQGFVPPYEATLAMKLRQAGAIILGKTVLTELANWVSDRMPGNYSAVGNFGFNPYDPRPDPRTTAPFNDGRPVLATGGSSSGIATAASLAAANVGTETSGSILSPANQNMLAGIKPTVGLISRWGVIPITADQDTAGPMARDVSSAAVMLGAMTGFDGNDPATARCPYISDYTPYLDPGALAGARIGFPRNDFYTRLNTAQKAVMDEAIAMLTAAGATVQDATIPSIVAYRAWGICASAAQNKGNDAACSVVLKYGFKRDFNAWLASLGSSAPVGSLTELIAFNNAHVADNAIKYAQARLDISDEMDVVADEARYLVDRAKDLSLTAATGLDAALKGPDGVAGTPDDFDALLFPAANGADIAARPGYPTVIVPFGFVPNAPTPPFPAGFVAKPSPFGMAFTGSACSEPTLIAVAYAFEQATKRRVQPESTPPLDKDVKGNARRNNQ